MKHTFLREFGKPKWIEPRSFTTDQAPYAR